MDLTLIIQSPTPYFIHNPRIFDFQTQPGTKTLVKAFLRNCMHFLVGAVPVDNAMNF